MKKKYSFDEEDSKRIKDMLTILRKKVERTNSYITIELPCGGYILTFFSVYSIKLKDLKYTQIGQERLETHLLIILNQLAERAPSLLKTLEYKLQEKLIEVI